MKYKILTQISEFLSKFKKITTIKRVADCAIKIAFDDSYELIFDLNKSGSSIYKSEDFSLKEYKAPFDTLLKKRLNSANIDSIETLKNNRILKLKATQNGSYKSETSVLYLEFTGRFTNAILTDENGIILEALRHFENERRAIKVGKKLDLLEPFDIKEGGSEEIKDFDSYFSGEFLRLKTKRLDSLKVIKIQNLDKKIDSLKQALSSLQSKEELKASSLVLSQRANLIIANLYLLKDFDRILNLKDHNGESLIVQAGSSPKLAANEMFKESRRLLVKAENVGIQIENLKEKIDFLNKLKNAISLSQNAEEIATLSPKKRQNRVKSNDLVENFFIGEFKISVAKSQKGSAFLLQNAKKDDFWFHLKDRPSTHVIVRSNKQSLNDDIVRFAAKICATFSIDSKGNYLVDYTKKRNVKIVNGSFVNYVDFKTIMVKI